MRAAGLILQFAALTLSVIAATGSATALAQTAAGTLLVVNKAGHSVSLIDLTTGTVQHELPTGAGPHEIAVSPDGRTAVISNYGPDDLPGNSLTVIDIAATRVVTTLPLGIYRRPHGVAWLPDNRQIVVTAEDNQVLLLIDVPTGRIVRAIPTHGKISHMVAVHPDGQRAYVTSIGSGDLTVIDIPRGRVMAQIPLGKGAEGIALSPDGSQVWAACREDDSVTVLDSGTLKVIRKLDTARFPVRVTFSPDGKTVLITNARASSVEIIAADSYQRSAELSMRGNFDIGNGAWLGGLLGVSTLPIGTLVHPAGKLAFVANTYGGFVAVIDLEHRRITGTILAGKAPDGLGYTAVIPE